MDKICATCKFFRPVTDHRLFDGACHNMRATLGAVIQTSCGSTCNYHDAIEKPDAQDDAISALKNWNG